MERSLSNSKNGVAPLRRFYFTGQLAAVGIFLAAMSLACNFLTNLVGNEVGL